MNCKICGSPMDQRGYCPVCGWTAPASTPTQPQDFQNNLNQSAPQGFQNGFNQPAAQGFQNGFNQPAAQGFQNGFNQPAAQGFQNGFNQPAAQSFQNGFNQPFNQPMEQEMRLNIPPKNNAAKKKSKAPLIAVISTAVVALAVGTFFIIKNNKPKDLTGDANKKYDRTTEDINTSEPSTTETPTTTEPIDITYNPGSKTIMMYIVGSNLESQWGSATSDITEILNSGFDDSNINYLIYTGGANSWNNNTISADYNSIYLVQNGDLVNLENYDVTNMGNPDTLSQFLNYGYENYPAEEYGLILWNHGGGIFWGYGSDEISGDYLNLAEMQWALDNSPFDSENPLEFIGFDACLMASIEIADTFSPYANYLIASQESEPGNGWDYSFLADAQEYDSGEDWGKCIVDKYISTTTQDMNTGYMYYYDITLSVMDLTKADEVELAIDSLFSVINQDLNENTFSKYARIRNSTKVIASEFQGDESYDVIDLVNFAENLENDYPSEASDLLTVLDEFIIYSGTNEENANGVSIYFPYEAKDYAYYYIPQYQRLSFSKEYTSFVTDFADLLCNSDTLVSTWDYESLIPFMNGSYRFSIQLDDEQVSDLQNAYFVISRADTTQPGNQVFVMLSPNVVLDESNLLTADFDGQVIYMQNQTTSDIYEIMYVLLEQTPKYSRFIIPSILYNDDPQGDDSVLSYFVMETSIQNPSGEIISAYPMMNLFESDSGGLFPDRYELNVNDYQNVAFGNLSHEFTSTENLTIFTEEDWSDVTLGYNYFPVSDGFTTIFGEMQSGIPYYGMFIFEDSQGNRYPSNLVQIQ